MATFQHKINPQIVMSATTTVALIFILMARDPFASGPTVVLIFLCLVFIAVFNLTYYLNTRIKLSERFKFTPSKVASYYSSILVATGAIFLIGSQTIGQLQLADVLLVACFEILANFYVLRRL